MTDLAAFLPPAIELALAAGRRVMALLKDPLITARKADKSIVTNADHAANDILRAGLRRAFPSHRLISEETGAEGPPDAEQVWLVDPLDGTKAYARGEPGFSVMAGLLLRGAPVLGVVYDPWRDHLYEAVSGGGCFLTAGGRRERLFVSGRAQWPDMPMIVSSGFPDRLRKILEDSLRVPFLPAVNSVGVKVGFLVRAEADLYVNPHPVHLWDTAAPQIILEEAGGRITDWDGAPLAYPLDGRFAHPGPTVATNGPRHADLVDFLSARG